MTSFRVAALAIVVSLVPVYTIAQEITLGLGATDFRDDGEDSAIFEFEYRHRPFFERRRFSTAIGATASVTGKGDLFVGAGIWNRFQFENGVFIESSFMPGLSNAGTTNNDLGSTLEFRSLLGVGYKFDNARAISAGLAHKSNAGLGDDNPGLNTLSIRYHISF